MQYTKEKLVVGLDIGTTKICVVVGRQCSECIEIIGSGQCRSNGLRKGFVINIESTATSIRKAVEEAEHMSGFRINNVVVGIADRFVHSLNTRGMVAINGSEVVEHDVRRAIAAAQTVPFLDDRKILHVIPQEFIVDTNDGIKQPIGMSGEKLEVRLHLVSASFASISNIIKSCSKAGLEVDHIVFQPLASASAVLMPEECEMGVVLIDIGGGTTDIALFSGGTLRHTSVIPIAGNHLSGDLATWIGVTMTEAERLKYHYGSCQVEIADDNTPVEVFSASGAHKGFVTRHGIRFVLRSRLSELLSLVSKKLALAGFNGNMAAGAVLTGGSSLLSGIDTMAEQVLGMPVRLGKPRYEGIFTDSLCLPQFSTGVGLVLNSAMAEMDIESKTMSVIEAVKRRVGRLWGHS